MGIFSQDLRALDKVAMTTAIKKLYEEADAERIKIMDNFPEVAMFAPPSYSEMENHLYGGQSQATFIKHHICIPYK